MPAARLVLEFRKMRKSIALALLVAAGCGKELPMRMSTAGAPPIDGEAPAKLETATFALG
jgi:hypothetical protein